MYKYWSFTSTPRCQNVALPVACARIRTSSNSNSRGSSKDRKARKLWLLREFGDGTTAQCSFAGCTQTVTFDTLTVDRYPIAGRDGGSYKRGNIRPACAHCNYADGGKAGAEVRLDNARLAFDTQTMVS